MQKENLVVFLFDRVGGEKPHNFFLSRCKQLRINQKTIIMDKNNTILRQKRIEHPAEVQKAGFTMKLLIKQRVFSWSDTYDVYDENGNAKYFVKAEFLSLGHRLHVYDRNQKEVGMIKERLMTLLPVFEIEVGGYVQGRIEKKFTLFRPKYEVEFNGWRAEGDFLGWEYDVYSGCSSIIHITKELFHWGDTYVIDFADPADELMGLLLVIAIDAANCTQKG